MNLEKLNYLKRAIKRTYKRYTGERTDRKATLVEVAKFFNIPIEEEREQDYHIEKVDYTIPSIELMDTKKNIFYTSIYTGDADMLNYGQVIPAFIKTISISPTEKIESIFCIGEKEPIITRLSIANGEYNLTFEHGIPNSIRVFGNSSNQMKLQYSKNVDYNGRNEIQPLLTKVYQKRGERSFERLITYGTPNLIDYAGTQDTYTYIKESSIIYGVNEFEQHGMHHLCGICFESIGQDFKEYLPLDISHISQKDYLKIDVEISNSAIVFRGRIIGKESHHVIRIDIHSDSIHMEYNIGKYIFSQYTIRKQMDETVELPRLNEGKISCQELANVITFLQTKYGKDEFIELVIEHLEKFSRKIEVRNESIQEELDLLSPKFLIDKTMNEIAALINADKDCYFKRAGEQFEIATNLNIKQEKGKEFTLSSKK